MSRSYPDKVKVLLGGLLSVFLIVLGYFTSRTETVQLFLLFGAAFGCAGTLYFHKGITFQWREILFLGMFLRLVLLFMFPNLSDDIYRFIWDGRILANGMNPYEFMPKALVGTDKGDAMGLNERLFERLNSPAYHTVYPPVDQFMFGVASIISGKSWFMHAVVLRVFILAAEWVNLVLLGKLATRLGVGIRSVLFYALNPLVIIELTGNLHFEALMLAFVLGGIYLLYQGRYMGSAFSLAGAVAVKLIPLMLMPFMVRRLGWRSLVYFAVVGLGIGVLFLPFLSMDAIRNFGSGLELYFQSFEFNASIYYLVRWIGLETVGYNMIATMAPLLSGLTFLGVFGLAFGARVERDKVLPQAFLLALALHLFLSTTVHSWYITPLVGLSVISRFRFPIFWSLTAVLSYSAYRTPAYTEDPWLLGLEYTIVYAALFWELLKWRKGEASAMALSR